MTETSYIDGQTGNMILRTKTYPEKKSEEWTVSADSILIRTMGKKKVKEFKIYEIERVWLDTEEKEINGYGFLSISKGLKMPMIMFDLKDIEVAQKIYDHIIEVTGIVVEEEPLPEGFAMPTNCPSCGASVKSNEKNCEYCGVEIAPIATEAAATTEEATKTPFVSILPQEKVDLILQMATKYEEHGLISGSSIRLLEGLGDEQLSKYKKALSSYNVSLEGEEVLALYNTGILWTSWKQGVAVTNKRLVYIGAFAPRGVKIDEIREMEWRINHRVNSEGNLEADEGRGYLKLDFDIEFDFPCTENYFKVIKQVVQILQND